MQQGGTTKTEIQRRGGKMDDTDEENAENAKEEAEGRGATKTEIRRRGGTDDNTNGGNVNVEIAKEKVDETQRNMSTTNNMGFRVVWLGRNAVGIASTALGPTNASLAMVIWMERRCHS